MDARVHLYAAETRVNSSEHSHDFYLFAPHIYKLYFSISLK